MIMFSAIVVSILLFMLYANTLVSLHAQHKATYKHAIICFVLWVLSSVIVIYVAMRSV